MGHSTVSFVRNGYLNYKEALLEIKEKKSEDNREYGYQENPDSFLHASNPETPKAIVYSYKEAMNILNSLDRYESKIIYYLPQDVFDSNFLDKNIKSKVDKNLKDLNKLLSKFNDIFDKILKKDQIEVKKDKFCTCPTCNSKINIKFYDKSGLLSSRNRVSDMVKNNENFFSSKINCPICRSSSFYTTLVSAFYSKGEITKINTLFDKMKQLYLKDQKDKENLTKEVDLYKVLNDKKLSKEIKTLICADVHH